MGIQRLDVSGYRSFREAQWLPGDLNLVVGPNASGKSNLLRLLELVATAARGELAATIRRAGGMIPLLWDHASTVLSVKVKVDPSDPEKERDPEREAVTFSLRLDQLGQSSSYEITSELLGNWYRVDIGEKKTPLKFLERNGSRMVVYDVDEEGLIPAPSDVVDTNETLLSQLADPISNPVITTYKQLFGNWRIHHDVPVGLTSDMRAPTTVQKVSRLTADGSNLAAVLFTLYDSSKTYRDHIDHGMQAAFGREYEGLKFRPAADGQIQLAVQWSSSSDPHGGAELSDGTLRFLFLIAVLSTPDPPSLIAIDEPEVGLHPSMLPIVADYAAEAAERTQVVLTTHSPEFLDHFTSLDATVTVCHWEKAQTHLFSLDDDALHQWLKQYRLGELFTSGELETLAGPAAKEISEEFLGSNLDNDESESI